MTAELPLLRTKTAVPLLRPGSVRRPRLTAQINRGVTKSLTLVSAPAGFGKTNLLVEWVAQSVCPIAWLTLDGEDNDLNRFFRYLISAFQEADPRLGEETLDFLRSTKNSQLEMGMTLLINEISTLPKDIVLVLDEFHVLEDAAILQSLDFFLKHLPHNLHLLVASRQEPALDLAFSRAKGQVTELGADELRFTSEEVTLFFKQTMGFQLPSETIQTLEKRTEGWITGLQLTALSLRNQSDPVTLFASFHGDAHHLAHFLSEEVLNKEPEEIRQFLVYCSILEVLSGPLCEAVAAPDSQPGYGARMLDRLDHSNLFLTPLDESHRWFRFHHLFADFLRHVLAETYAPEMPLLHKRASIWFERQGDLDEAFKHALAAEDPEWAAILIQRNLEMAIKVGEIFALAHWIGKLPHELIHQNPHMGLAYAWSLIAAYQLDNAKCWLDDIQQALIAIESQQGNDTSPDPATRATLWNIQGGLAVCRSTLALLNGDVQKAAEYSQAATSYLDEDNPFIHSMLSLEKSLYFILLGDTSKAIETLHESARIARQANNLLVQIVVTCQMAEMQAMQGHLSQALATLQKAQFMALGPDGTPLSFTGIVDNEFGEIFRERNMLEESRKYLERGRQLTQAEWSIGSLDGWVSLARLLQSQGNFASSQALIMEAAQMALSTESSQWDDVYVSAIAVRLALQRNDLAAAIQWWKKGGIFEAPESISLENYPYHIFEYLLLTQARFHFAIGQDSGDTGQLHRALELLRSILPDIERFKRVTSKIEVLILRAMVKDTLGESEQAVNTLLSALALGEPEDYRRIYLDEGQGIADLLARCRDKQQESGAYSPSLQYIESLLEACRQEAGTLAPKPWSSSTIKTHDGPDIFLSAREIEVLSLIAEGKSNQEIAEQLFLALNTVKRHAYNIYAKLEVNKRTQAVSKARELGILS